MAMIATILSVTVPIVTAIIGGGWRVLHKLDRLADSVDALSQGHADNSQRITSLEGRIIDHVLDTQSHRGRR